jgi:hypothetical protein
MSTLITSSTAAGEVFPHHIQFQSKAKSINTAQININVAEHMQQVLGKFRCKEVKPWSIVFGINKKGGMDNKEFTKYIWGSISPLFPDAVDKPGHCLLLKMDGCPGQMSLSLLASLKLVGIVL